jgi:hypothetical protein
MAASFLAVFVLGMFVHRSLHPGGPSIAEPAQVARNEVPAPAAPAAPKPAAAIPLPSEELTADSGMHYVDLPVSGADAAAGPVRLPVVERNSADEAWSWGESLPAAMPDDVIQALRDTGHTVLQQRRLLPMRMRDGRSLVVPYDEVEIRYVGGAAYQ